MIAVSPTAPQPTPAPSMPVAQFVNIESSLDTPAGSIKADVRLDTATPPGGTTQPSTMRLVGTVLGQPLDETRTAPVDPRERELMAAVRQAFEGADLIGRSTQLEDARPPALTAGMIRVSFTGLQNEGRYIDIDEAKATPAELAFGEALEQYGTYAFPA